MVGVFVIVVISFSEIRWGIDVAEAILDTTSIDFPMTASVEYVVVNIVFKLLY